MNFVSTEFDLPLFLVSRNRFKYQQPGTVQNYIAKQRTLYQPPCVQEIDESITATHKKFRHLVGLDNPTKSPCPGAKPLKITRDLTVAKPWQLPPNRYSVTKVAFAERRGANGAYWPKLHKLKLAPAAQGSKPQFRLYDKPGGMDCLTNTCNKFKGVLLSNARERRATTRCMVSNPLTCYRSPEEPSATTHYSQMHEISRNICQPLQHPKPNPYIFLRQSCVPAKPNAIHARNASFDPAPGRYENRFPKVCPCSTKRSFAPGIQLLIDREKRRRFRRQPHYKLAARLYYSTDWSHVAGKGYPRLFKLPSNQPELKLFKGVKKSDRQYILYPDARYIHMINEPHRNLISVREEPLQLRPIRVTFNCTAKRVIRRQLRNNKKIAFMSGQDRFKDSDRPVTLTLRQLEQIKKTLPPERQLHDQAVMRRRASQIDSRLNETPPHMRPQYELRLKQRLYKFLPLPVPKILVTTQDTEGMNGAEPAFYGTQLNVLDFCKADAAANVAAPLAVAPVVAIVAAAAPIAEATVSEAAAAEN